MKPPRFLTPLFSLIGLALLLATMYVLLFPRIGHNPHPVYAESQVCAEAVAYAIEVYINNHGMPPPTDGRLSRVLFGENRTKTVYLEPSKFRTNQAGYFLDAKQEPYQITITSNSVTVIGLRGQIKVERSLGSEPK